MDGDGVSILPTVLHGGFRSPVVSIVLDGQKDQFRGIAVWREPAGVEQHVPSPESGEGVFNLEVFNGMAVAQDLGQQRSQLGDVPLAVAQDVDEAALRLFRGPPALNPPRTGIPSQAYMA
jgi:hypothetical protein